MVLSSRREVLVTVVGPPVEELNCDHTPCSSEGGRWRCACAVGLAKLEDGAWGKTRVPVGVREHTWDRRVSGG